MLDFSGCWMLDSGNRESSIQYQESSNKYQPVNRQQKKHPITRMLSHY
jgi:hypothetical protein